jgi:hypothetical protein
VAHKRAQSFLAVTLVVVGLTAFHWQGLTSAKTIQAVVEDDDVANFERPLSLVEYRYARSHGRLPAWIDRTAFGVSPIEYGLENSFYPPRWLAFAVSPTHGRATSVLVWFHALIGALAIMALARLYGVSPFVAGFSGLLFSLSHEVVRWAPFWRSPPVFDTLAVALLGTELIWQRRPRLGASILAVGFGLGGLGGGVYAAQFAAQLVGLSIVWHLFSARGSVRARLLPAALCTASLFAGLAIASGAWLPFLQAQAYAARAPTTLTQVAGMSGANVLSLFDPIGGLHRFNGDLYAGIVTLPLALIGIWRAARNRASAFIPFLLACALLIGFKTPLLAFLTAAVPGWKFTTSAERVGGLLAPLPLSILAGLGLDWLVTHLSTRRVCALVAVVVVSVIWWQFRMSGHDLQSRAMWVAAFGGALALLLCTRVRTRRTVGATVIVGVVASLTVLGAMHERNLGWALQVDRPLPKFNWLSTVARLNDPDGRWMSHCQELLYPNYHYRPMTFLEVPGNWVDSYFSFSDQSYFRYWRALTGNPRYDAHRFGAWFQHEPTNPPPDVALTNAAGVTRILGFSRCGRPPTSGWVELGRSPGRSGQPGEPEGDYVVYANPGAYPMAYVSRRWQRVDRPDQAVDLLRQRGAEFATHEDYVDGAIPTSGGSSAAPLHAIVARHSADTVVVRLGEPLQDDRALVVLLDAKRRGWKAYVGSAERPIVRVNGVFRGVIVGRGARSVTFRYQPFWTTWLPPLQLGVIVIVIVIAAAAAAVPRFRWSPTNGSRPSRLASSSLSRTPAE